MTMYESVKFFMYCVLRLYYILVCCDEFSVGVWCKDMSFWGVVKVSEFID